MARGRKPDIKDNVIQLTVDGRSRDPEARKRESAEQAAALKPSGMPKDVARFWDDVAPALAERNRLDPLFVWSLVELCHCLAKMAEYRDAFRALGETYEVFGRNGKQMKSRPEVAQFNETRRTALRLFAEFGMTPSAARALNSAVGQGDLFDDFDDFASNRVT